MANAFKRPFRHLFAKEGHDAVTCLVLAIWFQHLKRHFLLDVRLQEALAAEEEEERSQEQQEKEEAANAAGGETDSQPPLPKTSEEEAETKKPAPGTRDHQTRAELCPSFIAVSLDQHNSMLRVQLIPK